ncbi:MAG: Na/Pi cotransporter family protein [Burkholderiaceae bacterium]|nr:Na/Pi cotransporter family protein [Burkholderiaceae bacterium]
MTMMSDGLKLAAGAALERILAAATRTRWHGLGSGVLVTAMVQSSTAVTVATIGFVNAGLLALGPSLWVLFGANVGTTMTGWIVALVGLRFKIDALALPLIGVGVLLRMTGAGTRRAPVGDAVAGFGLLFLGIALLQQAFGALSGDTLLPAGDGVGAVLLQVGAGLLMTVLTQSSSAAMAITLTAAQGGLLSAQSAAAVIIGANVGTTVTALMATVGATPNARRAALAHVAFNVVTAAVALAMLPWMVDAIAVLRAWLGLPPDPAARLALFHTAFNVFGVLLMWPLATPLTHWLQRRFRSAEEDESRPRFLDENVLPVPELALQALAQEIARVGGLARRTAASALAGAPGSAVARERDTVQQLDAVVERFIERLSRAALPPAAARDLARWLRVLRYHETAAEQAVLAAQAGAGADAALPEAPRAAAAAFVGQAHALLAACGASDGAVADRIATAVERAEVSYQAFKAALLDAGATGAMPIDAMEAALARASALRRALDQAAKAARLSAAPAPAAS